MPKEKKEPAPTRLDPWEQAWQQHWQKVGFTSYELNLPDNQAANRERNFLMQQRSPSARRPG